MAENYINHIALVVDRSSSMQPIANQTIQVVDQQVQHLAQRSRELDQETRATVYLFNHDISCAFYDKDVLRLPSIRSLYRSDGATALMDATARAIEDLKQTATLYGDHAFLIYVITDGEENRSQWHSAKSLSNIINGLPDNWTVAAMVPNQHGVFEAKRFGFPAGNIQVWDTSAKGMQEVGEVIRRTTDTYMQARTMGVRSTSSLFSLDLGNLTPNTVRGNLTKLGPLDYSIVPVTESAEIRDYVVSHTGRAYRAGSAFYELSKREEIQPHKEIAVRDRTTGDVFTGPQARTMLNLPDMHVKVGPGYNPQFDVFVQSTSVNRKLVPGTELLILQ